MSSGAEFDQNTMEIEVFFVAALGLMVGSFLNVCISRIPRGESIVFPGSHCPSCGTAVKPYDNIPILSFLLLRGKCRSCRQAISWQYPVVELLTFLIFIVTYLLLGLQIRTMVLIVFSCAMVILVFIDLNERILPDVITLSGVLVGLVVSLVSPVHDGTARLLLSLSGVGNLHPILISFSESVLGALVCGGFLWLVAEAYYRVRKVEGLGFGDIKLMAMVGAFLGVRLALLTIMLGSFLGAAIGLAYIKFTGKDNRYELPFGTFLGLSAIVAGLWGGRLVEWYVSFPRP